ncbi:MAG: TIM barrel protein [Phycisphaerales bacterium]|jgi:sugar phosphate isomerase/epimerase|nr:TIM barrel protein [Phycisphaerales bacterium]
MTLLLSLTTRSLQSLLDPNADPPRTLLDAPAFASSEFGLRGLSVDVDMLAGWSVEQLSTLRHRGDQAACPCLVLVDTEPLAMGSNDEATQQAATQRLTRVATAANRLGCNSVAVRVALTADDTDEMDRAAQAIQDAMVAVERLELNLLLVPGPGGTQSSDQLAELIKKVGGFRIGALPTYGDTAAAEDQLEHVRKLAPYAGAIHIRCEGFKRGGAHRGLDLAAGLQAAKSVGYQSNVAIDYVGEGDPAKEIARAVEILQAAIDAE